MTTMSSVSARPRIDGPMARPGSSQQATAELHLVLSILNARNIEAAARVVVEHLPDSMQGCRSAVGLVGRDAMCRLLAVTDRPQIDRRSERVRTIEAALDEATIAAEPPGFPNIESSMAPAKTHERLAQVIGAGWIVSHPLQNGRNEIVGAWLVWGDGAEARAEATRWLRVAQRSIATALETAAKAGQGPIARAVGLLREKMSVAGAARRWRLAVVAATALLCAPAPFRIDCEAVLEPVSRRYVAAPFDATLARTLVEPGDIVGQGQLLVELDGREIRWELATLEAAFEKAQKARDVALAEREASDAQLARLEMEQLEHQMALLRDRQQHLRICSPLDGVVISGDLQRVEGAPLTKGQSLLEIAPLDRVVVEAAIPEQEVTHVADEAATKVRLDAFPGQDFAGELATIHPRGEIRKDEQVFIAELELENPDGGLRPGMSGTASVSAGWAPAGWILFRKPFYAVRGWLGW